MGLTTYSADGILNHILGKAAFGKPAATYAAFHNGDPGLTGANEIMSGWYDREEITWNAGTTSGATNDGDITFNAVAGSQDITHICIWDHATKGMGNCLFVIALGSTRSFSDGAIPKIPDEQLSVNPGSAYSDYLKPLITDHLTGNTATTLNFDTTVHLSLHTANPGGTGTSELSAATSYARQAIEIDAPSSGTAQNSSPGIAFAVADYSATVTHYGIWDSNPGGNLHVYGAWSAQGVIANGDTPKVATGALDFTAV